MSLKLNTKKVRRKAVEGFPLVARSVSMHQITRVPSKMGSCHGNETLPLKRLKLQTMMGDDADSKLNPLRYSYRY